MRCHLCHCAVWAARKLRPMMCHLYTWCASCYEGETHDGATCVPNVPAARKVRPMMLSSVNLMLPLLEVRSLMMSSAYLVCQQLGGETHEVSSRWSHLCTWCASCQEGETHDGVVHSRHLACKSPLSKSSKIVNADNGVSVNELFVTNFTREACSHWKIWH